MIRPAPVERRVFRLGVIELRPGSVRLYNRTSDRTVSLSPAQEARWRRWLRTYERA